MSMMQRYCGNLNCLYSWEVYRVGTILPPCPKCGHPKLMTREQYYAQEIYPEKAGHPKGERTKAV